ncbi:TPR repeat-containing protein DDB_G0287407-like [Diadema antillarum]|uniref:TPR repeat-containing protein DDB_G0287407-like n=1 Tax=Diadema antillarum TaxID=105358 RepID=UPI003A8AEBB2
MKGRRNKTRSTKEENVARVFFSSPFGGLEEERELLTKQYWPELAHLCQRSGYEFVPVDMRWGITSELSKEAATITICLRELDRSDMIVGFFGQRYGWHGSQDEFLQKTFDHAVPRYPWLDQYRDRSVTELEFLHGHLNKPGTRPACFFFRDKAYDDAKLAECIALGDERGQRKFRSTSDGPRAAEHLDNLKQRVNNTKDKCLAVHMNYTTPEVGARLMFETVREHLSSILGQSHQASSEMEKEHAQHETFLVTRRGMGGGMVGGEAYLEEIDRHVIGKEEGNGKHLLLLGDAGSGKSCVLANWMERHLGKYDDDILAFHFIGCTSNSTRELDILRHVCYQIEMALGGGSLPTSGDGETEAEKTKDERDMQKLLLKLINDVSQKGLRVVIVIDALDKVDTGGRAVKELYWLPKVASSSAHIILSTTNTDTRNIRELVDARQYDSLEVSQLTRDLRSEVTKKMLLVRGKELSPGQMEKVLAHAETGNPLYLYILLQELCSFGSFFELDDYIDFMLTSTGTVDLFQKFLQRLEKDYNPEGKEIVKGVMCCLLLAHRGLSENELKAIVGLTNQEWSSLFFAMDDFLLEAEGLYRFAFSELASAVEASFCPSAESKMHHRQLLIKYFMSNFKKTEQLNDLVDCLSSLSMFNALSVGQAKYDLMQYWMATGLPGDQIVQRLLAIIDDQVTLLYLEKEKRGASGDNQQTPAEQLLPVLVELTNFLDEAGYTLSMEPILLRLVKMHKARYNMEEVERDVDALDSYCELKTKLACHYASTERFDEASKIHREVLDLRERHVDRVEKGKSYLAVTLNNLGFIFLRQHKFDEAEDCFGRAVELHREVHGEMNELVASALNNVGMVLYGKEDYKGAYPVLEKSLKIYEEVFFGQLPPDIGGTYMNFAMCSARLADKGMEDVEPLYKRALEIRINALGTDHPTVAQTYLSYGSYLMRIDQLERALAMTKDALKISEIANGPEHHYTLMILENIALGYLQKEQPDVAHHYYHKAGEILHKQGRMMFSHSYLNSRMITYYLSTDREPDAHSALVRVVDAPFATARDYAALDYLDSKLDERPNRPYEHSVDFALEKFPDSDMLLGRKITQLAPQGRVEEMLAVLERGNFEANSYNLCCQDFVMSDHKPEGLRIMERAAEKFPEDTTVLENLAKLCGGFQEFDKAADVLDQAMAVDGKNLDLLALRVRMLGLGNRLREARDLVDVGLPLATEMGAVETIEQLEQFKAVIDESLASTLGNPTGS